MPLPRFGIPQALGPVVDLSRRRRLQAEIEHRDRIALGGAALAIAMAAALLLAALVSSIAGFAFSAIAGCALIVAGTWITARISPP